MSNVVAAGGSITLAMNNGTSSSSNGFKPVSTQVADLGSNTSINPAFTQYLPFWANMGGSLPAPNLIVKGPEWENCQIWPGLVVSPGGWSWAIVQGAAGLGGSIIAYSNISTPFGFIPGNLGYGGWACDALKYGTGGTHFNGDFRLGCTLAGTLTGPITLTLSTIPKWVTSAPGTNKYAVGISVYYQKNGASLGQTTYYSDFFDIIPTPCAIPTGVNLVSNPYTLHWWLEWRNNNTVDIDYQSGFDLKNGPIWTNLVTNYNAPLAFDGSYGYDVTALAHTLIAFPQAGVTFRIRGNCTGAGLGTSAYVYYSVPDIWSKVQGRRLQMNGR